jgi:protein-S-isoprenylcysteine O-methyltransferase Ste14
VTPDVVPSAVVVRRLPRDRLFRRAGRLVAGAHPAAGLASAWGLAPLIGGAGALLWCVRDFYVVGGGTLAPWDPTKRLVVVGLYRYSRNPMYIAVSSILAGWAISLASWELLAYLCVVVIAFELRVVYGEEPGLMAGHAANAGEPRSEAGLKFLS